MAWQPEQLTPAFACRSLAQSANAASVRCSAGASASARRQLLRDLDRAFLFLEPLDERRELRFELRRLAGMLGQKIRIERAVVVEPVAAGGRAGVECQSLVARAVVGHVLVAEIAVVLGQRDAHRLGDAGTMLLMAGHAVAGVEHLGAVGIARIGELRLRMRVVRGFQLGAVTATQASCSTSAPPNTLVWQASQASSI